MLTLGLILLVLVAVVFVQTKARRGQGRLQAQPAPDRRTPQPGSTPDQAWRAKLQEGLDHAKDRNWGLYVNTRLDLAQMARKEGRDQAALELFLEVAYLDLCGPNNGGPWRAADGLLAPKVVEWIAELTEATETGGEGLAGLFQSVAQKQKGTLKLRMEPATAWKKLHRALAHG